MILQLFGADIVGVVFVEDRKKEVRYAINPYLKITVPEAVRMFSKESVFKGHTETLRRFICESKGKTFEVACDPWLIRKGREPTEVHPFFKPEARA